LYADDPERIHMAKTTVKKAAAMKPVKKAAKQGSKTC
jgi:hypothetical protein